MPSSNPPPRQWLYDRSNGKDKLRPESKPPNCCIFRPPPFMKVFPGLLEQNKFCEYCGAVGIVDPNDEISRRRLMRMGLFVHWAGLFFSVLACFAVSSKTGILQRFPMSSGTITGSINGVNVFRTYVYIGLTTVNIDAGRRGSLTLGFSNLCDLNVLGEIPDYLNLVPPEDCLACQEVSFSLVTSLFVSVIAYIPAISTNILRSYFNYDVNCQKMCGSVVQLISMGMSLYSWFGYGTLCFANFYQGTVDVAPTVTLLYDWTAGNALVFVVLSNILKIFAITAHFVLPTPTICRDRDEQLAYEERTDEEEPE